MFLFLARQLLGLKKIDDPLFSRRYYLLEVTHRSMFTAPRHAFTVAESEHGSIFHTGRESRRQSRLSNQYGGTDQSVQRRPVRLLIPKCVSKVASSARKKHTDQLKNLMVEIISVILAEYESVPFALLELLFARIIDPEKVLTVGSQLYPSRFSPLQKLREECYELVESIIRRGESFLKPAIAEVSRIDDRFMCMDQRCSSTSKPSSSPKIRSPCIYIRRSTTYSMNYAISLRPSSTNSFQPSNID